MTRAIGQNVQLMPDEAKRLGLTLDDIQAMYMSHSEDPNFPESCMPWANESRQAYSQFIVYLFLPPIYRNIANACRVFYAEEAHLIGANEVQRALIEQTGEKTSRVYSDTLEIARKNQWRERAKDFDQWKQRMVLTTIAQLQMDAPLRAFSTLVEGLSDRIGANRIRAAEALLNRTGFPAMSEKSITHNREVKSAGELSDDELKFEILKRLSGSAIEQQPAQIEDYAQKPTVNLVAEAMKADVINGTD